MPTAVVVVRDVLLEMLLTQILHRPLESRAQLSVRARLGWRLLQQLLDGLLPVGRQRHPFFDELALLIFKDARVA